jgi:hypothetical protein
MEELFFQHGTKAHTVHEAHFLHEDFHDNQ